MNTNSEIAEHMSDDNLNHNVYDMIIIGAGASGLFAAACLDVSSFANGVASFSLQHAGSANSDNTIHQVKGSASSSKQFHAKAGISSSEYLHAESSTPSTKKYSAESHSDDYSFSRSFKGLILEKTLRPGTKLLMSGSGQCNITHAGSIKDFVKCYGDNGKKIRSCLYKHSNLSLIEFLENNGIETFVREDGKVFPASMDAHDVLYMLLRRVKKNGFEIKYKSAVTRISKVPDSNSILGISPQISEIASVSDVNATPVNDITHINENVDTSNSTAEIISPGAAGFAAVSASQAIGNNRARSISSFNTTTDTILIDGIACNTDESASANYTIDKNDTNSGSNKPLWCVHSGDTVYSARSVIIATGGCSYPSTGSDGSMFKVLKNDLDINITKLRPALSSIQVQDYPYCELSGISFSSVHTSIWRSGRKTAETCEDLLFTHKDLSGPAIINISKFAEPGDRLKINYLHPMNYEQVLEKLKSIMNGAKGSPANIISTAFDIPKRFSQIIVEKSGASLKALAASLTGDEFIISSVSGFNRAMATSGGIDLSQINTTTFEFKKHQGLYAIGEALDVDGITGGYNLQLAYSSAKAAVTAVQVNWRNSCQADKSKK